MCTNIFEFELFEQNEYTYMHVVWHLVACALCARLSQRTTVQSSHSPPHHWSSKFRLKNVCPDSATNSTNFGASAQQEKNRTRSAGKKPNTRTVPCNEMDIRVLSLLQVATCTDAVPKKTWSPPFLHAESAHRCGPNFVPVGVVNWVPHLFGAMQRRCRDEWWSGAKNGGVNGLSPTPPPHKFRSYALKFTLTASVKLVGQGGRVTIRPTRKKRLYGSVKPIDQPCNQSSALDFTTTGCSCLFGEGKGTLGNGEVK